MKHQHKGGHVVKHQHKGLCLVTQHRSVFIRVISHRPGRDAPKANAFGPHLYRTEALKIQATCVLAAGEAVASPAQGAPGPYSVCGQHSGGDKAQSIESRFLQVTGVGPQPHVSCLCDCVQTTEWLFRQAHMTDTGVKQAAQCGAFSMMPTSRALLRCEHRILHQPP